MLAAKHHLRERTTYAALRSNTRGRASSTAVRVTTTAWHPSGFDVPLRYFTIRVARGSRCRRYGHQGSRARGEPHLRAGGGVASVVGRLARGLERVGAWCGGRSFATQLRRPAALRRERRGGCVPTRQAAER